MNWTQQHPAHSPPAQQLAAMTYDEARGQVILVGTDNTTWVWDGPTPGDWTQLHPTTDPNPGNARSSAALAFDPGSQRVVLFGGLSGACGSPFACRDTWTWDGNELDPGSAGE